MQKLERLDALNRSQRGGVKEAAEIELKGRLQSLQIVETGKLACRAQVLRLTACGLDDRSEIERIAVQLLDNKVSSSRLQGRRRNGRQSPSSISWASAGLSGRSGMTSTQPGNSEVRKSDWNSGFEAPARQWGAWRDWSAWRKSAVNSDISVRRSHGCKMVKVVHEDESIHPCPGSDAGRKPHGQPAKAPEGPCSL